MISSTSVGVLLILLQLFVVGNVAVPVDKFYPYGIENGDTPLPINKHDVSSQEVTLGVSVRFYGETYNSLFVNGNGLISFLITLPQFINAPFPLDYPGIAPLYTNIDNRAGGHIFYREDTNERLRIRAANEILQAFPQTDSSFRPSSLFIATWDRVASSRLPPMQANTFQAVIISNGTESYVQFLYADDGIQWLQGEGNSGTGLPDAKAQAGLTAFNGRNYGLPGTGTDQIRNLARLSNTNEAGVWIFRVGNIGTEANVEVPDARQIVSQQVVISQQENSCATGYNLCHSQANCVDINQKLCCVCRKGFYGNGFTCLKEGVPLRANGKVNLDVNGVRLTQQDLQAYVIITDGRVYTAISKVPPSVGNLLQVLYPVTTMLNWLFAIPTSNGLNGFQITGGVLDHSAEITFKDTNDKVLVVQKMLGLDVYDQLKVDMHITGKVPLDVWEKLAINDYQTQFNFLSPGLFRSSSSSLVYKITSPTTHEEVEKQISLEQTIRFNESCSLEFSSVQSGQKSQYSYYRVKTARNFVSYEASENILRFAATSKVSLLTENEDPCIEGRVKCVVNSSCIVEGDSFKCSCNPGFRTTYARPHVEGSTDEFGCLDVNECAEGKASCDENAMCVNEVGSHQCICKHGYTGNGYQCTELETPCGKDFALCNPPHSQCDSPNDYRTCKCLDGFQKKYIDYKQIAFVCPDRDECESRPCGPNSVCRNLEGSYTCECKTGYDGNGYQCQKTNVTCDVEANCSPNGECIYYESSHRHICRCINGYYGDGYRCQRYGGRRVVPPLCIGDECLCPPNFVTVSNLCFEKGYTTDLPPTVSCNLLPNICHPNALCVHNETNSEYSCACKVGYEGNGFDCNEVEVSCLKNDLCDAHATCQVNNRTGKASCVCNPHYHGDGSSCVYIGACYNDNECNQNEECYYNDDTLTYECRCKAGYGKGPNGYCISARQCPVCYPTARCVKDPNSGTSYCECPPGYRGDGVTYCEIPPPPCNIANNCSPSATCRYNSTSANHECHCKPGFAGNGIHCSLVASCFDMPEVCDRNAKCVRASSSYVSADYQCQCNPRFFGNGTHCTEIPTHEGGFLFVNWGTATLRVPYEPSITNPGYPIQLQANQIAIGLAIDCMKGQVFWSDYLGHKLKTSTFKGKNVTTVAEGNITSPEGVALDWLNQVIYWTDSGRKVIEAINVDGTQRQTVISKNLTNPRGIAVDPYRRKIFWSDWNRAQPKIEWSNLDGSGRSIFVSGSDVQLPNSVTIDTGTDELCWADAGTKRISCIGIESRQKRTITSNCVSPFGLAVSHDRYYWTEKSLGKIGYFDKQTQKSGNITLPSIGTGTLYGIVNVPMVC